MLQQALLSAPLPFHACLAFHTLLFRSFMRAACGHRSGHASLGKHLHAGNGNCMTDTTALESLFRQLTDSLESKKTSEWHRPEGLQGVPFSRKEIAKSAFVD